MRGLALAFVFLLAVASPALGDDSSKKHQVDSRIATLQDKLASQRRHEHALQNEVAGYTQRIRSLEAQVGDVSLKLSTLEADLSLHQRRLDALNELFGVQTRKQTFLRAEYHRSVAVLERRIVDIYESDDPSTLDVFLGSQSVQEALDKAQYLDEISAQDKRVAAQVAYAKTQVDRKSVV